MVSDTANSMPRTAKIYVAGHRGMVGSALCRQLSQMSYVHLLSATHVELDLTDQTAVDQFFKANRPDYVFLTAAKVGGILANNQYPADFIYQNLAIQTNVIHSAWRHKVKRLLFVSSSCSYPKSTDSDFITEDQLLSKPLEPTNRPYAVAKIAGVEMCWAYNRQHNTRYIAAMPTNLYGPNDHYDLQQSHVIPALIRKCHEAKINNQPTVTLWGTGKPLREFLYCEDLAEACIFLMNLPDNRFSTFMSQDKPPMINIGHGKDISIHELAELIKKITGYKGKILWDSTKPDGTLRKTLDVSKMTGLGWQPKTSLKRGIELTYQDFCAQMVSTAQI